MVDHRKPVGVRISTHAIDRDHERFPGVEYTLIPAIIYREVQQALAAGRRTSRLPRWVHQVGYATGRRESARYVFNDEQTRCYAIVEDRGGKRGKEFGKQWVVKTTLAALTNEQLVEERRLRKLSRQKTGSASGSSKSGRAFHGHKAW